MIKKQPVLFNFICFTLLLTLASWNINAQVSSLPGKDIIFDQLPASLGFTQRTVNCILQDRDGYLWVGTWSGLLRYDGYNTEIYQADDEEEFALKSNKITSLLEDASGNLWVGTRNGGLFRYDKTLNRFYQFIADSQKEGSLSNDNVLSLLLDQSGNLWVGTENGLNLFDPETENFQKFFHIPGDSSTIQQDFINYLYQSKSGKIWVATGIGISVLEDPATSPQPFIFKNYQYGQGSTFSEKHNYIYQIGETNHAGKEVLWFATIQGLKKFEEGRFRNFLFDQKDKDSEFNAFRSLLVFDQEKPFILLGSSKGLNFFDPEKEEFTRFLANENKRLNLSQNDISALYLDNFKVLWVGTRKGINKFDSYSRNFEFLPVADFDQSKSTVSGIRGAANNNYWISTHGGGIFKFNPQKNAKAETLGFTKYKVKSQGSNGFSEFVQTIYTDAQQNVWIGTGGAGLLVFNERNIAEGSNQIVPEKTYSLTSEQKLTDNHVMSFADDPKGGMWVGTWSGGLNKVTQNGSVIHYNDSDIWKVPLVVMFTDRKGVLWVGTRGNGLYRVLEKDGGLEIKIFQKPEGMGNHFIDAIHEDSKGRLWVGTEGGLFYYDPEKERFSSFKTQEAGIKEVVVGILEDEQGKLWLSHWKGITVIDPADSTFTKVNYDTQDRIQGGFFYSNVCFKDENGKLVFGGGNGLNIINPANIISNPVLPKVSIENFQIFNKKIEVGKEFNGRVLLQRPMQMVEEKEVALDHHENSVSFEFTGLHFAAPEKIRYAFKLEGFDLEWQTTDASRRYVSYTNLPEGSYEFKVKATNNDGIWNEKESQFPFIINPPFWKTNWAILLYVLFAIFALHIFRKLVIMRTNFMNNLRMERVKRESLEELNQAKLEFFTNISHEFRTPLTLIAGPVQTVLDSGEGTKGIRHQLTMVSSNVQRLLRLVNQLLDFRKIEAGNVQLEVGEEDLVEFVKEIKLSFEGLAGKNQIDFSFQAVPDKIMVWIDRNQFEKILFNVFSNAFKNTPSGGRISINLTQSNQKACIRVEDTGSGISPENLNKVFNRFYSYQEDPKIKTVAGTGIGLALTKSLVELHHGTIEMASEKNKFTRVAIQLPLGKTHFQPSEIRKA